MTFAITQKVLFKHCDPAGIVFYPRYFEMMNDCVEAFFDHIGTPFEAIHKTGGVPTVRIEAEFAAPSKHGDRLDLVLSCLRIGRTSLDIRITSECAGEPRMRFLATLVHIGKNGRPDPWPAGIREKLASHITKEA